MSDIDVSTNTWREFLTQIEAQNYCDLTWAAILYAVPDARIPPEFLALRAILAAAADAAGGDVRAVPGDVIRSVSVVPVYGLDHLGDVVTDGGESQRWAVPRLTASGEWAVPCLDTFDTGGPEPVWPDPAPVLVSLVPATSVVGQPVTVTVTCDPVAGAPFTPGSVIHADGAPLPTVFVDASTLTVSGTPIVDGTADVTVANGLFVSNALTFTVTLT